MAEELNNISQACKLLGVSRDTFYRYKDAHDEAGLEALLDKNRRKPNLKNRVDQALEKKELLDTKVDDLAREIHSKKFSEEYDFMYDANDRHKRINPMSKEHIEKINKKRINLGVSPLSESGERTSDDTFQLCVKEAKKIILGETDK